jgi:hypothetical protein
MEELQEFDVVLYESNEDSTDESDVKEVERIKTWGTWTIESSFLIVWSKEGLRQAHMLHEDVVFIDTEIPKVPTTVRGVAYVSPAE